MSDKPLFEPDQVPPLADEASPDFYRELINTGQTRLVRMELPPGAKDRPHRHPQEIVYFTSAGTLSITLENGEVVVKDVNAGDVMHNGPWAHQVSNTGDTPVEAIIYERLDNDALAGP